MTTTTDRPVRVANYTIGQGWKSDNYRLVADRRDWQGSNFRGERDPWRGATGMLPREHRESFAQADYAVYSYATPIAWHIDGQGWIVPDTKYSVTTTRQQSQLRMAFHYAGIDTVTP